MPPLLVLLTLIAAAAAPRIEKKEKAEGVGPIDAICAAPSGHASKRHARIFVETSGAVLPKPREGQWRELATEAELHALSDGAHAPNTEAVVVKSARGATLVSMYFQDSSQSWAHVVDYCFRAAGPLARLRGTFNSLTAVGPGPGVRRRRAIYYDAQGGVLRSTAGVFDIDTDRALEQPAFLDEEDPLYPSVRALPFSADLLPPAPPVDPDPDRLAAAVRERLPAVKACYQRAQKKTPDLAGKAIGRWTVDPAGKVTAFTWQSDEIKSAPFSACAQKVIESWRFPKRDAPVDVSFPFVFGADIYSGP